MTESNQVTAVPEKASQDSVDAKDVSRRTVLAKYLKTICAVAAVPIAAQVAAPKSAFAHDRDHDGGGDFLDRFLDRFFDRFFDHHDRGHHGGGHDGGHGGGNCFLRGTRISTVAGERRVEDLSIGDLVPTAFGETRPIQWIGRFRRVRSNPDMPWVKSALPVRIARSALAPNVPHADLYVTQGHALLLDDLLIPAGKLINDKTISLYAAEQHDELEFFHVKLESHDVVYAEGAPCETLLRVDETMSNFADYLRKYGEADAAERHCAPIVCNGLRSELRTEVRRLMSPWLGRQKFDQIRARLERRAMTLM
jgi:Hint domain